MKIEELKMVCNEDEYINLNQRWQTIYSGIMKDIPKTFIQLEIDRIYASAYPGLVVNTKIKV